MAASATRPRKPARPRPPARVLPPVDDEEVIALDEDGDDEPEPARVPVFSIGEQLHTMIADPPPSLALSALELAERRGGTPQAIALADVFIMRAMLGEPSYRALLASRKMTRTQYLKIVAKVMKKAMGALEDGDGSPNR